ncbi:hypothetical protein GCM10007972_17120 [Iodidimonas muriae]|uniref:Uncharacterized protein n=1 Tax=Iodidimonas muriae TaxID=261467 RepID=A0ABQ2LDH8_9PROT|nr:hypothetical protein JCM17843_21220 [Kordiimonadales bacterium JCM 17843]GGO12315.1 hypothetical protein GCM10007972_17120 [Iodidimonas muriae]
MPTRTGATIRAENNSPDPIKGRGPLNPDGGLPPKSDPFQESGFLPIYDHE